MTNSSFSKSFLLPNEQIVFQTNPHWLFLIVSLGQILLFFLLYFFFACPLLRYVEISFEHYCYVASLMILVFISLIFYLDWRFNRLYLTNFRLIKERGIIGKRYMSVRLPDIQDITCSFGILGRILEYGDLTIESAGTHGQMVFKGIPRPRKIKILIDKWRFCTL